jgi:hypothetical protein
VPRDIYHAVAHVHVRGHTRPDRRTLRGMTSRPPAARYSSTSRDCREETSGLSNGFQLRSLTVPRTHVIAWRSGDRSTALSYPCSSEEIRSGAGQIAPAGLRTHPTPLSMTGRSDGTRTPLAPANRGWWRSDALKCNRVFGLDANDARPGTTPGHPDHTASISRRTRLEGFMWPSRQRSGPKEMRIPPLRSAVKMGSDVSPSSSVTLGRRVSSDALR